MTVHLTLVRTKASVWMKLEHTTASALQDLMEPTVSITLMNVLMSTVRTMQHVLTRSMGFIAHARTVSQEINAR